MRRPKDLQCFLLDEIKKLCANAPPAGAYNWLGRISGHPGDVISQLQHGNKTAQAESILDLCPDIYGLLVPYIKIYRVVYAPGNPFQIQAIQECQCTEQQTTISNISKSQLNTPTLNKHV